MDKTPVMGAEGIRADGQALNPLVLELMAPQQTTLQAWLIGKGIQTRSSEFGIFCIKFTARNINTSF